MLTTNSKLKKDNIFSFNLEAELTCFGAKDCIPYCYAAKNFWLMPSTKKALTKRLELSKRDDFALNMVIDIIEKQAQHVRIHASGDFYNREYVQKWFTICEALPHVIFYAYTKSLPLFIGENLPNNLTIIYSYGGKFDHMIDPSKDRHAKIFTEQVPEKYIDASHSDLNAITKNKNVGLVLH